MKALIALCLHQWNETRFMCVLLHRRLKRLETAVKQLERVGK